jgi:hypothetical protein
LPESTLIVHTHLNNALAMTTPVTPAPKVRTMPEVQRSGRRRRHSSSRDLIHALFLGGNALGFVLVQLEVPDAYLVSDDTGFNIIILSVIPLHWRLRAAHHRIITITLTITITTTVTPARLDPSPLLSQPFYAISIV